MKIVMLEIEAFRGYRERVRFDFSASSVILLYGPNGHGKTSFFDAIEWALSGNLFRFSESTDERNQSRFIGNSFTRRQPCVHLELFDESSNVKVKIVRTGTASARAQSDYGASRLSLDILSNNNTAHYEGEQADEMLISLLINKEWSKKVTFNRTFNLTHVLGQDRFQDILRGMKDSERYDSMSQIFGTEHFYEFRTVINEAKQQLALKQVIIQSQYNAAETEVEKLKIRKDILQQQMLHVRNDLEDSRKTVAEYAKNEQLEVNWGSESPCKDILSRVTDRKKVIDNDRQKVNNQRIALIKIEDRIPDTIQHIENSNEFQIKVERLEDVKKLRRKMSEWNWLNQHADAFLSASETCKRLDEQYKDYTSKAEKNDKNVNLIREFVKDLQAILANERETNSYTESLSLIQGNHQLQSEMRMRFAEHLMGIQGAHSKKLAAEQLFNQSKQLIEQINGLIAGKTEQNRNLREFLSTVQNYVQQHEHLSNCPACGTHGISVEHLMIYTRQQQMLIDPGLVELEQSLESAIHEQNERLAEFNQATIRFTEANEQLEALIRELEVYCQNMESESYQLYAWASETNLKLVESQRLTEQFLEVATQCELEINNNNSLKSSITSMIQKLSDEWVVSSNSLGIDNTSNIDQLILECEREIRKANNQLLLISEELTQFNIIFMKDYDWIKGKFVEKIVSLLKGYSSQLTELDDEEKRLLKVEEDALLLDHHREYMVIELQLTEELMKKERAAKEIEIYSKKIQILDEMNRNVPIAVDKLNDQVINQLFSSIQQIFDKLNCHPLYRKLSFSTSHRYRANRLLLSVQADNEEAEVHEANPSYIFSSAQENTLVLSFFLAMARRQQWSPLSLIALDDPLQSMDDLNVLSFIDLMRDFADRSAGWGKQIIISTHDLSFYELMRKKFRHMDIGVVEFESYGANGPIIRNDRNQSVHIFSAEPKVEFPADFLLSLKE